MKYFWRFEVKKPSRQEIGLDTAITRVLFRCGDLKSFMVFRMYPDTYSQKEKKPYASTPARGAAAED